MRTRILIDFWNLQIEWNEVVGKVQRINWIALSTVLTSASQDKIRKRGLAPEIQTLFLEMNHLAGSVSGREKDKKLEQFLTGKLGILPDWDVKLFEREYEIAACPACLNRKDNVCAVCRKPFTKAVEKGADVHLATSMLRLGLHSPRQADCFVLVTQDADFIPAVEALREVGVLVVNATWDDKGNRLRSACDTWISIDALARYIQTAKT